MNTATVSPAPKLFAIALGIVLTIAAPQFADKWMLYLWNFVTGSLTLHAVASLPSGTSAAGAGQIGPWGGLPRGPPGGIGTPGINPASTALGPARAAAEREAQQGVGEQLAGLLARAVRAMRYDDASARTNQEGKTSSGTAVDSDSFENATWLAVLVDAAVGSIPGVGTIIGVYDAYGVLTDADSTTGDRVYAVISVLPGGKIVKVLARTHIVQSGIKAASHSRARRNVHLAGKPHPDTGIPFDRDGYPDFSAVSKKNVEIEFSGNRRADAKSANSKAGLAETPEGYVWHHHQDGKTMQLVPEDVHRRTGHDGGHAGR